MAILKFDDVFTYETVDGVVPSAELNQTVGTITDVDGYMKYAPHNFISHSEDYANSVWIKTDTHSQVETAASVTSPNQTTNTTRFYTIDDTNTDLPSYSLLRYFNSFGGSQMRWSVFAKSDGTSPTVYLMLRIAYDGSSRFAVFDLVNGTVYQNNSLLSVSMMDVGDGWYHCSVTDSTGTTPQPYTITLTSSSNSFVKPTVNSSIYVWGSELTLPTEIAYQHYHLPIATNPDNNITVANTDSVILIDNNVSLDANVYFVTQPNSYVKTELVPVIRPRRRNSQTTNNEITQKGLLVETSTTATFTDNGLGVRLSTSSIDNWSTTPYGIYFSRTYVESETPPFVSYYLISCTYNGQSSMSSFSRWNGRINTSVASRYIQISIFYKRYSDIPENNPNPYLYFFAERSNEGNMNIDMRDDSVTFPTSVPPYNYYIVEYPNGWRRAVVIFYSSVVDTSWNIYMGFASSPTNRNLVALGPVAYFCGVQAAFAEDAYPTILNGSYYAKEYVNRISSQTSIKNGERIVLAANTDSIISEATVRLEGYHTFSDGDDETEIGLYEWYLDSNNYIAATLNTANGTGGYNFYVMNEGVQDKYISSNTNLVSEGHEIYFNVAQAISNSNFISYINNVRDGSNTAITGNTQNIETILNANLYFGAVNSLSANFLGTLKEFRVWNYQIDDTDISTY